MEKRSISFYKRAKPFKGFISTWLSYAVFTRSESRQIFTQFKNMPILTNMQYIKVKYRNYNCLSVSFDNEADEAAFLLLISGGEEGIEIEYDHFTGF